MLSGMLQRSAADTPSHVAPPRGAACAGATSAASATGAMHRGRIELRTVQVARRRIDAAPG